MTRILRLVVGLGLPVVATLATIPFVSLVGKTFFGVPTVIVALGSLFFIVSGSMAACRALFDRDEAG